MKYKKILVTGKNGTMGSNISIGVGFPSKEYDLRDEKQCDDLFKKTRPDAVIHLAAKVGGLKYHMDHKYDLFHDNALINLHVLDHAKKNGVKRVLSYLSSCIFSDKSISPYKEADIHHDEPFNAYYPYGYSKRMLEVQSRICYEELGLIYNCVIPTNIYGAFDDFNYETGHVVGVLIRKAHEAAKENKPFRIWGNGKQVRDLIFAEDMARLTQWALYYYIDKEPIIFSSNTPIEIGQLAYLIAKEFNIENKLEFDVNGPSGQQIRILDGSKVKELTNFQFTPIQIGLKETIKWFLHNYPNVRL